MGRPFLLLEGLSILLVHPAPASCLQTGWALPFPFTSSHCAWRTQRSARQCPHAASSSLKGLSGRFHLRGACPPCRRRGQGPVRTAAETGVSQPQAKGARATRSWRGRKECPPEPSGDTANTLLSGFWSPELGEHKLPPSLWSFVMVATGNQNSKATGFGCPHAGGHTRPPHARPAAGQKAGERGRMNQTRLCQPERAQSQGQPRQHSPSQRAACTLASLLLST